MVRKGGLEPPCLSAPPPQDGVSANFTTSAHRPGGAVQPDFKQKHGDYSSITNDRRANYRYRCPGRVASTHNGASTGFCPACRAQGRFGAKESPRLFNDNNNPDDFAEQRARMVEEQLRSRG